VGSAQTAADSAFARAHAALLGQHDLQFKFAAIIPPKTPEWLKAVGQVIAKVLVAIAPAFKYIFWGGLIIGLALIVYFVARELLGLHLPGARQKAEAPPPLTSDWRPPVARVRTLLRDADELAAQGRFAEAVHLLLFRSIDDIDERWPNTVSPSLTSRDIAAHTGLSELARRTFMAIAGIVEANVFGGAAVGEAEFAECRRAYADFGLGAR
jgi:hypothetical protein